MIDKLIQALQAHPYHYSKLIEKVDNELIKSLYNEAYQSLCWTYNIIEEKYPKRSLPDIKNLSSPSETYKDNPLYQHVKTAVQDYFVHKEKQISSQLEEFIDSDSDDNSTSASVNGSLYEPSGFVSKAKEFIEQNMLLAAMRHSLLGIKPKEHIHSNSSHDEPNIIENLKAVLDFWESWLIASIRQVGPLDEDDFLTFDLALMFLKDSKDAWEENEEKRTELAESIDQNELRYEMQVLLELTDPEDRPFDIPEEKNLELAEYLQSKIETIKATNDEESPTVVDELSHGELEELSDDESLPSKRQKK